MIRRENQPHTFWKSLSALDWAAFALSMLGFLAIWGGNFLQGLPALGMLRLVGLLAGFYLLYRFWTLWRTQLLWSLRNRLIVAYLFIAVVPIILLLILASLLGQIIYSQLGAYLLYHDIEDRLELLTSSSEFIAAAESTLPISLSEDSLESALATQMLIAEQKQLPGLVVNFSANPEYFREVAGPGARSFAGLVQRGTHLHLVGMRETNSPRGRRFIELSVPVTTEFLEVLAPDLGPIDVTLAQTVDGNSTRSAVRIGGKEYRAISRVLTKKRVLPTQENWMDPVVDGFSQLNATYLEADKVSERNHPVFAFFKARRSQLNHRLFASLGDLSGAKGFELQLIAVFFLVIEMVALVIGVVLTRAITRTIADSLAPPRPSRKATSQRAFPSSAETSSVCSANPSIP